MLCVLVVAAPNASAIGTLYAAPLAAGSGNCSSAADACTLTKALTLVSAGGTIELIQQGTDGDPSTYYDGPFKVSTSGTWSAAPVTILGSPDGTIIWGSGDQSGIVNGADFLDIANVTFEDSGNGAVGLTNDLGGTVSISDSSFRDEQSGAIENADVLRSGGVQGGVVDLSSVVFEQDTSTAGAAINNVAGTVSVTGALFADDHATNGGVIANAVSNGSKHPSATVTVSNSYFELDSAAGDGGAIDNGAAGGNGTATIEDSTFDQVSSTGGSGGVIANGTNGTGTASVSESSFYLSSAAGDGGVIENGRGSGKGTLNIEHSTMVDETAGAGASIDNADGEDSTVRVAADVFGDPCVQQSGEPWLDAGYNVGSDESCFDDGPSDVAAGGSVNSDTALQFLDDPSLQVDVPLTGNPAIALVPTTASALCPVVADERGLPSPPGGACDAGAVQTPIGELVAITAMAPIQVMIPYKATVRGGGQQQVPIGTVEISDGDGGTCTTGLLKATSVANVLTATCAIRESAQARRYAVTATTTAGGAYGSSSASIVQTTAIANETGDATANSTSIDVAAEGGIAGKSEVVLSTGDADTNSIVLTHSTSYFNVATTTKDRFHTVSIEDCDGVSKSGDIEWWNPALAAKRPSHDGWAPVTGAHAVVSRKGATECEHLTLSAASSPTVADLADASFATQEAPLTVSASSLLVKEAGRATRVQLHAVGGNAPYAWKLLSGGSSGLSLTGGGLLRGTLPAKGTFFLRVVVSDAATATYARQSATATVTLEAS